MCAADFKQSPTCKSRTVTARADHLVVNDHAIRAFHHERPERIPWADAGVDVVIEATGRFRAGTLARTHIKDEQLTELQRRLVLSHAAGTGDPLPDPVVRAILILKINGLARGFSGIRRSI